MEMAGLVLGGGVGYKLVDTYLIPGNRRAALNKVAQHEYHSYVQALEEMKDTLAKNNRDIIEANSKIVEYTLKFQEVQIDLQKLRNEKEQLNGEIIRLQIRIRELEEELGRSKKDDRP